MMDSRLLPIDRFLATLAIVVKEADHLDWSCSRLFEQKIDTAWVESLSTHPEMAERLEAFVSRYGRLQDTMADKLFPRWLLALAEKPGSQIEVLNRVERLGVLEDVASWLEARQLRNRLVHENMTDSAAFAEDLNLARRYSRMLLQTCRRLHEESLDRFQLPPGSLP